MLDYNRWYEVRLSVTYGRNKGGYSSWNFIPDSIRVSARIGSSSISLCACSLFLWSLNLYDKETKAFSCPYVAMHPFTGCNCLQQSQCSSRSLPHQVFNWSLEGESWYYISCVFNGRYTLFMQCYNTSYNVTSGSMSSPMFSPYTASKHALHGTVHIILVLFSDILYRIFW